jgi:putative aldouronate transport system substrate-binding protein
MRHPEVAMRWIDHFFSWEGALEARIGVEGTHWYRAAPGTLSYAGLPARWGRITAIGGPQTAFWSQWNMAQFNRHDRQTSGQDIYAVDGLEKRLFEATNNYYIPFRPRNPVPPLFIAPDVIRRINQPWIDIRNYVQECIVMFATGSMDLDRDWDSYVNNLQRMGTANVLAAFQTAYDSYLRNR